MNPDFDRAADRCAVVAELQQRVALAIAIGGDAVVGEHEAHHPFHAFGVVLDLGHVFAQDPPGHVLRRRSEGRRVGKEWRSQWSPVH